MQSPFFSESLYILCIIHIIDCCCRCSIVFKDNKTTTTKKTLSPNDGIVLLCCTYLASRPGQIVHLADINQPKKTISQTTDLIGFAWQPKFAVAAAALKAYKSRINNNNNSCDSVMNQTEAAADLRYASKRQAAKLKDRQTDRQASKTFCPLISGRGNDDAAAAAADHHQLVQWTDRQTDSYYWQTSLTFSASIVFVTHTHTQTHSRILLDRNIWVPPPPLPHTNISFKPTIDINNDQQRAI